MKNQLWGLEHQTSISRHKLIQSEKFQYISIVKSSKFLDWKLPQIVNHLFVHIISLRNVINLLFSLLCPKGPCRLQHIISCEQIFDMICGLVGLSLIENFIVGEPKKRMEVGGWSLFFNVIDTTSPPPSADMGVRQRFPPTRAQFQRNWETQNNKENIISKSQNTLQDYCFGKI